MTVAAVLGAGAGGLATVVELTHAGYEVNLWNRNPDTIAPYADGISYRGLLGEGTSRATFVSTHLAQALDGVSVAVVSLPAFLHARLFDDLAALGGRAPVVLSPGHTGGALHFRQVFSKQGVSRPPVAELSTLPYVCRCQPDGVLSITGRALRLRCGTLPGDEQAGKMAAELFDCSFDQTDVLASSLSNVNFVLHPPGAVLAAAWVEATEGAFRFYVDAMTTGVGRVIDALDQERLNVAMRLGHRLLPVAEEMCRLGTVPEQPLPFANTAEAVRSGEANRAIRAPGSFAHRYYKEDFAYGLAPFLALAQGAGVSTPTAASLLFLGRTLAGDEMPADLDATALGIVGFDATELVKLARR